jgi:hypothetical protein
MRADGAAIEKRQAQRHTARLLLGHREQAFPDAQVKPAVEALCRHPPRSQRGGNGAPFGTILVAPDDRLERAAQVRRFGPAARPYRLKHRRKPRPLAICQNAIRLRSVHEPQIGRLFKV